MISQPTRYHDSHCIETLLHTSSLSHISLKQFSNAMLSQRFLQRSAQYAARQSRAPAFRKRLQQRFASSGEQPQLTGAADNAFNRERLAVKKHAAESSGQ